MLFRTIVNSTKLLFLYLLIQLPSPKIKIPQNSNLKANFQAGVDSIYDAIVAKGSTPASKSLGDVVAGINALDTSGAYAKLHATLPTHYWFTNEIIIRDTFGATGTDSLGYEYLTINLAMSTGNARLIIYRDGTVLKQQLLSGGGNYYTEKIRIGTGDGANHTIQIYTPDGALVYIRSIYFTMD